MNTPTPTPRTEAHFDLALQIAEAIARSGNVVAARLIADSEARAVATTVSSLTCTHHNDQQRAECPVCLVVALTAERDQLRAEVERLRHLEAVLQSSAADMTAGSITAGGVADLRAENERLRRAYVRPDDIMAQLESAIARAERAEAELALLKPKFEKHCAEYNDRLRELRYAENMQRQAEAELAKERARLDWFYEADIASQDIRAAIDAAMKEDAK